MVVVVVVLYRHGQAAQGHSRVPACMRTTQDHECWAARIEHWRRGQAQQPKGSCLPRVDGPWRCRRMAANYTTC